jgi:xylulokinase
MLGTAGNLLFPGAANNDPRLLHTIHLTGQELPFGGVLAGGNLAWFAGLLGSSAPDLFQRLDAEAASVPPGSEGLIYLPYLMGERTPIWDPQARGAFIGLSSRHTRAHLYRAVLEGVAFAFRQIVEIVNGNSTAATAIDGGSRSPLWRQILADVLGLPIHEGGRQSGTALGSAFLAVLGASHASGYAEIGAWAQILSTTPPSPSAARRYDDLYPVYAGLYEKLQDDFHRLSGGLM